MSRRAPNLYINRELSWLEFNHRVLEEAFDETVPLLERLKFLGIVAGNLDEFFMVRVAGIKRQIEAEAVEPTPDGMSPREQDEAISRRVHKMLDRQHSVFAKTVRPALAKAGIVFARLEDLDDGQRQFVERFFRDEVYPILTPMAVDPGHPFPVLLNTNLYIAAVLEPGAGRRLRGSRLAFVQVPEVLGRFVEVPTQPRGLTYVFLEDVVRGNVAAIFEGYEVRAAYPLRVTRDGDLTVDEEGAEDLLKAIEFQLKRRPRGAAVRLEVETGLPAALLAQLMKILNLTGRDVYFIDGPISMKPFIRLAHEIDRPDLKDPLLPPVAPAAPASNGAIFRRIARGDVLVHHPYESFDTVVAFLDAAAADPDVLAIKQTLYRTTGDSPIVNALARAAQAGKEVTALVELKARFDEETNIEWAKTLEEAGANVIYGLMGLKTHCKAALVVRREPGGIRRYVHLSTGNYNEITARVYTDLGLFTADEDFGTDASALFNVITGYSEPARMRKFDIAPIGLRERLVRLICRERDKARAGLSARIIAKMNSLVDQTVIDALYDASRAGVKIDLLVRGICCLRPAVKGTSSNIRVTSIVDRFLEHGRIFYFHNGGQEEYYLSSADWMPRNLDRRIEVMWPVQDAALKKTVREILDVELADTVKARMLLSDGTYRRVRGKKRLRSQEELYRRARKKSEGKSAKRGAFERKLIPRKAPER